MKNKSFSSLNKEDRKLLLFILFPVAIYLFGVQGINFLWAIITSLTSETIKGIGAKSAQRIIIDLKDKVETAEGDQQMIAPLNNTLKNEALSALEVLGFQRKSADKALDKLISANTEITVEELIKKALKAL